MSRAGTIIAIAGVIALAATIASAECTLTETTVGGEPAIILENDWVLLRARPTIGGRVDQLIYKPEGKNLTGDEDSGLLIDRVWNYANSDIYQQWTKAVYSYQVEQTPTRVAITMSAPGTVGIGKRMTFTKTISLTANSSAIRADYNFAIGQEAMVPQRAGLWWHNRIGVAQEATGYFIPTTEGIAEVNFGAGDSGQYWWKDLARGWMGMAAESGVGVAAVMDFPPLMCMYNYLRGEVGTAEWAFRSREIPNGGSMDTTIWLLPFGDMTSVAGASARFVAQVVGPAKLDAPGDAKLNVRITAPVAWTGTVKLTASLQPDGEPIELGTWPVDLVPGAIAEHEVSVSLPEVGAWLITGQVSEGAKFVGDFFHTIIVGETDARVTINPLEKIIGRADETFADKIAARGSGPEDRAPSEEIVSPHVPWGKPLAGGPVKALILCDFLVGRETIELAERLEMDYTAPTIGSASELGYTRGLFANNPMQLEHVMDNLRKILTEDFDVIIIGGLSGAIFTDDVVDALLDKVRSGTGLVWANPSKCPERLWEALPFDDLAGGSTPVASWHSEQEHYLTTGIPWEVMPPTKTSRYNESGTVLARAGKYPLLAVNDYGTGRVVGLGYCTSWQGPGSHANGLTPWIQFAPTRFAYWEYYHSLLAKAMLWAAHREPVVRISALAVQPEETIQGEAVGVLQMTLVNTGAKTTLTAAVRIVDEFGAVEDNVERELEVPAGDSAYAIALPGNLRGGLHLVDVILRSGGKSVDWGTATLTVRPRVEVTALAVDTERVYRRGETLEATATLAGIAPDNARVTVTASLQDALGRIIVASSQESPGDGDVAISLQIPEPLTTKNFLRVEVRDADGEALDAAETKVLTMPTRWAEREWGSYFSTMWGGPGSPYSREYLVPIATARVKELGIESQSNAAQWLLPEQLLNTFEAGLRPIMLGVAGPELRLSRVRKEGLLNFEQQREQYTKTKDKKFLERPYCLHDPQMRASAAERLKPIAEAGRRYGAVGYCCGDELSITHYVTPFDYDFTPICLDKFREWLGSQYESLNALNTEWATDFATWDEVMPMTADEVTDHSSYAPWADHRTFMEVTYADYFDFLDDTLQSMDPGARLGISGTQAAEAYGGYDWFRLTKSLDFIQAYDHQNTGEMHRSFDHGMLTAPWWGYAQSGVALEHRLWYRLLNANDGGSFFVYNYFFNPDYTWTESTQTAAEQLPDIQGGLATLLASCDQRAADVLVHYSQPSIHAAYITGGQKTFRDNRDGWVRAIEDSGMQMEFLAYAQIEDGELVERMPRALVLPYSIALSDTEVTEIHDYVEAGGTLIADARCGLMTDHGRVRETGALDDLFGIKRRSVDPRAKRPTGAAEFTRNIEGLDPRAVSFEGRGGEPGIELTGGQALGTMAGQPALIVNTVGKGRAILLNIFLDGYGRMKSLGIGEPVRELVAQTLALAGAEPPIGARTGDDHHLYIARYLSGEATYVGVLRDKAEGRSNVKLLLDQTAHVYDQRAGKYLGHTDHFEALLAPGHCNMYSLLPYRVDAVKLRPKSATVAPGAEVEYLVSVDVTGGKRGLHVFRMEVTGPDGELREYYGAQLVAKRGATGGAFRLALNDSPGAWTITATDIATGVTGTATVRVEE